MVGRTLPLRASPGGLRSWASFGTEWPSMLTSLPDMAAVAIVRDRSAGRWFRLIPKCFWQSPRRLNERMNPNAPEGSFITSEPGASTELPEASSQSSWHEAPKRDEDADGDEGR